MISAFAAAGGWRCSHATDVGREYRAKAIGPAGAPAAAGAPVAIRAHTRGLGDGTKVFLDLLNGEKRGRVPFEGPTSGTGSASLCFWEGAF